MRLNPYPKSELSPTWTAIIFAVSTLVTNWVWGAEFPRAPAFVLLVGIFGWPISLAIVAGILASIIERCEDYFWLCAAIILTVLGVGLAVYGIPRPWSLIVCVIVTAYMGLKAYSTAQDDDALEEL